MYSVFIQLIINLSNRKLYPLRPQFDLFLRPRGKGKKTNLFNKKTTMLLQRLMDHWKTKTRQVTKKKWSRWQNREHCCWIPSKKHKHQKTRRVNKKTDRRTRQRTTRTARSTESAATFPATWRPPRAGARPDRDATPATASRSPTSLRSSLGRRRHGGTFLGLRRGWQRAAPRTPNGLKWLCTCDRA